MHITIQEEEEIKATIYRLEKESEELHLRLNKVTSESNGVRFNLGLKEKEHGESQETTTKEKEKRKRVQHCLNGANLELDHRNKEIQYAHKKSVEWKIM